METNRNNEDLKKFEGCLDRIIPIVVAIVITIVIYFAKK